MTKESKSGGEGQGARPLVVVAVMVLAAFVVLAAVQIVKRNSAAKAAHAAGDAGEHATATETAEHPSGIEAGANAHAQSASNAPQPLVTTGLMTSAASAQLSVQELIKALKDGSLPMGERKKAIEALAKLGTPEAIAALKDALTSGSEDLRAAVAEGLGNCASPECSAMLLGLLNDPNKAVIEAAIRGLSVLGTPEATAALAKLLNDPLRSSDLRTSAAAGLGNITGPGALQALSQAALTLGDEDIVTQVLDAIGGRDFNETKGFFQQYMGSAVSSDLRVTAIESLAQAQGNPTEFLTGYLTDSDADVRASAAWAMSATDATGNAGAQLLASLQGEQDPEVRRRLYQALANQEGFDAATALALVQRETDPTAKISGLDLLATTVRNNPTTDLQTYFDQTAAPSLKNTALSGESSHERMASLAQSIAVRCVLVCT